MSFLLDTASLLIIDDTPSNLGVVVNLFESNGYSVAIAQDGEEGLQRASLVLPDLILLDVMMPGQDGFEVCRQLKARPETRDIPVIFMTSLASVEYKVKGFRAGGVDYVTKPLQFDEVIARVAAQLKLSAMQKRLERQNAELQRYRDDLEVRVAERTVDLHLSNERLRKEAMERVKAQEGLAAREREFRSLAENIPDTIIRYDVHGRKTYINTAVARFIGMEIDALMGRTPQETLPSAGPEHTAAYIAALGRCLESGEAQEVEVLLRHSQLGERMLNIRFVAECDDRGQVIGALMVGRDVTAMKNIENELKEREQRYREIFDNALEGMYLLKVTEDGRFRNLDVNPALAESTGIPREAMIGRFIEEAMPEEAGRAAIAKYLRCLESGATIEENIELDLPAGKRHYISTVTPIYFGGRIHRLIGILRDITPLKQAERELEESRTQLRKLAARREEVREEERKYIAREVHDELGQILTGLQLDVSMLDYKFGGSLPELHEHLKGTLALVNKSLATTRNVASALRPASLDMGIVSAIEWLVSRFSRNTRIKCEIHVSEEERDLMLPESTSIAIYRITQESLTNVARHADAEKIDIFISRNGGECVLEVRDNGKGIDFDCIKEGSLGLVGIRERVHMLGGKLTIHGAPGEGTAIEVRIPLEDD